LRLLSFRQFDGRRYSPPDFFRLLEKPRFSPLIRALCSFFDGSFSSLRLYLGSKHIRRAAPPPLSRPGCAQPAIFSLPDKIFCPFEGRGPLPPLPSLCLARGYNVRPFLPPPLMSTLLITRKPCPFFSPSSSFRCRRGSSFDSSTPFRRY